MPVPALLAAALPYLAQAAPYLGAAAGLSLIHISEPTRPY